MLNFYMLLKYCVASCREDTLLTLKLFLRIFTAHRFCGGRMLGLDVDGEPVVVGRREGTLVAVVADPLVYRIDML